MTPHRSRLPQFPARMHARGAGPRADSPDWAGRAVLGVMFVALVTMLSLPEARAASATFGWLPLWLAGLPASAWLALLLERHRAGARPDLRPGSCARGLC